MAKFLRRVTVVDTGDGGGSTQTLLKRKGGKRKRVSRWLRPAERVVRQYGKAQSKCWSESDKRHDKSRGKKRDRWITDSLSNNLKSVNKSCRVLRKI